MSGQSWFGYIFRFVGDERGALFTFWLSLFNRLLNIFDTSASPVASKGDLHALGPVTVDLGKLSLLALKRRWLFPQDRGRLPLTLLLGQFRTHCRGGASMLYQTALAVGVYRASQSRLY